MALRLALTRLSEVAVRAMSSSINDIATATNCIDSISEVLVQIGCRDAADPERIGPNGRVRLIARYPDFVELLDTAFAPIRHAGASNPVLMERLLDVCRAVGRRVHQSRRAAVLEQVRLVSRAAARAIDNEDDVDRIQRVAAQVLAEIAAQGAVAGDVAGARRREPRTA